MPHNGIKMTHFLRNNLSTILPKNTRAVKKKLLRSSWPNSLHFMPSVSISPQPLYAIFVPLAAVKCSSSSINSEISLTVALLKNFSIISLDKIDTCAPVSHSTCDSMSFNKHLTVHRRPTSLAIFVYSLGVKWLTNVLFSPFGLF